MSTRSDLKGKFFYDVFTTAKEWATGLFYLVFPSKRPKPETVDDLTVEKKLWQKPTLLRKPPTVLGELAAMSGIGEWKDNRGNTLSGDALQCDGETSPRRLDANDATILHNASAKVHMNGRITGNIHVQGWQELNHLSPLEVGCNGGDGRHRQENTIISTCTHNLCGVLPNSNCTAIACLVGTTGSSL